MSSWTKAPSSIPVLMIFVVALMALLGAVLLGAVINHCLPAANSLAEALRLWARR